MLRLLSDELGIQIILTTHSPHMLNQEDSASNILLARDVKRGKPFETFRVETSGGSMDGAICRSPRDRSGVNSAKLRPLFFADRSKVLLVEGTIDQEYFCYFQAHEAACGALDNGIDVVPYGGKDTLKNTLLIQFVLKKFGQGVCYLRFGCGNGGESRSWSDWAQGRFWTISHLDWRKGARTV